MEKLTSILAVIDPSDEPLQVAAKAVALARQFGARVELFFCDAERAYVLRRAYDSSGTERACRTVVAEGRRYLETLRQAIGSHDVKLSTDAACESPLFQGIVRKVLQARPDLVIKAAAGRHPLRRLSLGENDWELARTCPASLMLLRGRPWAARPRFAAAVDISEQETAGLACEILHTGEYLASGCEADLDVLYSDKAVDDPQGRKSRNVKLRELAWQFQVKPDRVHVLDGQPEETLPAFAATRHYDALVLGALTHRKGLTAHLGTLTSKLVDALECDFVLVKPESYRCPLVDEMYPVPSSRESPRAQAG